MVFTSITYTNNAGTSITPGDLTYPATNFGMKVYQAGNPVPKMQFPGRWGNFSYPEYREIFIEGQILGTDPTDYNTKAKALRAALQVPYQVLTARRHGTLYFYFVGDATQYYIYVQVSEIDMPKEANYPSVGAYSITFLAFEPYLRKVSDDTVTLEY